MVKNNYLSISEIILGLREEYKKTLYDLNKCLSLDEGVNVYYTVSEYEDKRYVYVSLIKKMKRIEKLLNIFTKNLYTEDRKLVGGQDNHLIINDKRLFKFDNNTDLNKFYNGCKRFFGSEFYSSLDDKYFKADDNGLKMAIGHDGIYTVTDLKSTTQPIIGVDYDGGRDQMIITNYYRDTLFYGKVLDILDTKIPKADLNEHLVDIIDNNPISEYPIEFTGMTDTREPQRFDLEVENNRVLAKRVN